MVILRNFHLNRKLIYCIICYKIDTDKVAVVVVDVVMFISFEVCSYQLRLSSAYLRKTSDDL